MPRSNRRIQSAIPALIAALLLSACATPPPSEEVAASAAQNLAADVNLSLAEFRKADSSMDEFIRDAYGYAVFPRVGKGGLVLGGAHGGGLVYEKEQTVGRALVTKLSVGLQAGGQVFREIIFFENAGALARFKQGQFAFSAEATATVVADGMAASADYSEGVTVFVMPIKGLMLEASLGGQRFRYYEGG